MIRRRGRDHAWYAATLAVTTLMWADATKGIAPWNVAADRVNRHVLVAENDSRQGLDFDVLHRRPLSLGKVATCAWANLMSSMFRRRAGTTPLDLLLRKPERGRVPLVELLRDFA